MRRQRKQREILPVHDVSLSQRQRAFTVIELLIVIVLVAILAGLGLPTGRTGSTSAPRIQCVNNLKQIVLSDRLFEDDNGGRFPWQVTNNFGVLLFPNPGIADCFRGASNYLNSPKILSCPADNRKPDASFQTLTAKNISYFVGLDADETLSSSFIAGDRNISVNGVPVPSGRGTIRPTDTLGWDAHMHKGVGNVALSDGSVQESTAAQLSQNFRVAYGTNQPAARFLIP